MSPTTSTKTLRVRGLSPDMTLAQLQDKVKIPAKSKRRTLFSSSSVSEKQPTCILATQNNFATATISFASTKAKIEALKGLEHVDVEGWVSDDQSDGLTVLCSPEEIDMEYASFALP